MSTLKLAIGETFLKIMIFFIKNLWTTHLKKYGVNMIDSMMMTHMHRKDDHKSTIHTFLLTIARLKKNSGSTEF